MFPLYKKKKNLDFSRPVSLVSYVLTVLIILFFVIYIISPQSIYFNFAGDYKSYWAASHLLHKFNIGSLYDMNLQRSIEKIPFDEFGIGKTYFYTPFMHPPYVSYLTYPISFLGYRMGFVVYSLLILLAFIYLGFFISINFKLGKFAKLVPLLVFCFPPVVSTIISTQSSIILVFTVFWLYKFLKKNRFFESGAISAAFLFKPHYVLLSILPFIISKNKKKFIRGFLIVSVILFIISLPIGTGGIVDYFKLIKVTDSPEYGNRIWSMYSYASILDSLKIVRGNLGAAVISLAATIVIVYIYGKLKRIDLGVYLSTGIIFLQMSLYHVLFHDLSVLLFPIFVFIERYIKTKKVSWIFSAALLYFSPLIRFRENSAISILLIVTAALFALKTELHYSKALRKSKL